MLLSLDSDPKTLDLPAGLLTFIVSPYTVLLFNLLDYPLERHSYHFLIIVTTFSHLLRSLVNCIEDGSSHVLFIASG